MRLRFNLVFILITIAILTAFASIYLKYEGNRQRLEYAEIVILTLEITNSINEIVSDLVTIETGQRGYIITGDRTFYEPFLGTFDKITSEFETFKKLTSTTNAIPPDSIQMIEDLVSSRMESIRQSIEIYEELGFSAAQNFVNTGIGKRKMDEIRRIQTYIYELENKLLVSRTNELYDLNIRFSIFTYAGFLLSIGIMFASAIVIKRKDRENGRLLNDISMINMQLSNSVENQRIKDKYIGMAAHDLRNPIGAVVSFSDLIMEDKESLTPEQLVFMHQIVHSAEHSLKMLDDMLDVQKIDEGKFDHQLENIELDRLCSSLCAVYVTKAEDKNITLHSNIEAPNEIRIDKLVLIQVFDNLVSNAIKYSPSGTSIWIDLKYHNDSLQIRVKDEGPGIPSNEMPLLFQRFQKLSNRPTGGESSTGLGLSIVKDRLESIEGSIKCISEVGKGTEFIASIPITVLDKD
jgi:signal transduction histidine kinase